MKKSTFQLAIAFLAVASFVSISVFSGYSVTNLKDINWDIILMLTPYGLVKNLIIDQESFLYPYYFQKLQQAPGFSFLRVAPFLIAQVFLSGICLIWFRQSRQK